jgi:hypothetical protein
MSTADIFSNFYYSAEVIALLEVFGEIFKEFS